MIARTYQIYCHAPDRFLRSGVSSDPLWDLLWWQEQCGMKELTVLSPPLPYWLADQGRQAVGKNPCSIRKAFLTVNRELGRWGRKGLPRPQTATAADAVGIRLPDPAQLDMLAELLSGRALLEEEIYGLIRGRCGVTLQEVEMFLQFLVLEGRAEKQPAAGLGGFDRPVCRRCGERRRLMQSLCPFCGRECTICLACTSLGESRACRAFYLFKPWPDSSPTRGARPSGTGTAVLSGSVATGVAFGLASDLVPGKASGVESAAEPRAEPGAELHSIPGLTATRALHASPGHGQPSALPAMAPCYPHPLTVAQQQASEQLVKHFDRGAREVLVWAVCGAGKTEVSFQWIASCLQQGQRVLYAIPRRDVVSELAPRMRAAFPGQPPSVLPEDKVPGAARPALVLATTHQVLRFYCSFDAVILDEADAYPYAGSDLLHRAVERAAASGARRLYMTATPDSEMYRRVQSGQLATVRIPARFHGFPLAVPELFPLKRGCFQPAWPQELPQLLREFLKISLEREARVIFFVPSVALVSPVLSCIERFCRLFGVSAAGLHSRKGDRDRIMARIRSGDIRVVVSTTVLERGITMPRTDVAVLNAEHTVFDTGTLLQMAGRAGRTPEDPIGRVAFFCEKATEPIRTAISVIQDMNRMAMENGYLGHTENPAKVVGGRNRK